MPRLNAQVRITFRVSPCEIRGGKRGTGIGFSSDYFGVPLSIIPPNSTLTFISMLLLNRRTHENSLETFQIEVLFGEKGSAG